MTECDLERRGQRRLAVLRHVEEVSSTWRRPAAITGSAGLLLRLAAPLPG